MDGNCEPVVFRLGTKEYKLMLTAPAIRAFEKEAGKGIFEVNLASLSETVTLLWAAAKTNSPHLQLNALFEYVDPRELPRIAEALGECTKRAFGVADDEEKKDGAAPGPDKAPRPTGS